LLSPTGRSDWAPAPNDRSCGDRHRSAPYPSKRCSGATKIGNGLLLCRVHGVVARKLACHHLLDGLVDDVADDGEFLHGSIGHVVLTLGRQFENFEIERADILAIDRIEFAIRLALYHRSAAYRGMAVLFHQPHRNFRTQGPFDELPGGLLVLGILGNAETLAV